MASLGVRTSAVGQVHAADLSNRASYSYAATGLGVYFCEAHSPWQRGSNEVMNGLLRQYFPKGSDLRTHPPADLQAVAEEINGRPRRTLNWATPGRPLR